MISKLTARNLARQERQSWTPTQVQALSEQLINQVPSAWLAWPRHHIFWPISGKKEVHTPPLAQQLALKSTVFLPKVSGEGQLTHHPWQPGDRLEISAWGIPEPTTPGCTTLEFWANPIPTLVWVPLLAFDPVGYRVGYGKGFYDQFLREATSVWKVGLSLSPPLTQPLIHDSWDIRLDACLSPEGIWTF